MKDQSSGLYASQMAERGFAALAFDPSYTGKSGGEPRNVASPDIKMGMNVGITEPQLKDLFLLIQKHIGRAQAEAARNAFEKIITKQ